MQDETQNAHGITAVHTSISTLPAVAVFKLPTVEVNSAVIVDAAEVFDASTFVVDPTEQALVAAFGEPVRDLDRRAGPLLQMALIDTVVYIDKRILALDDERQEVLVSDNQRLEVDAFVRYRIADRCCSINPSQHRGADAQLGGMLNSALRRTLSEASITDIVRDSGTR